MKKLCLLTLVILSLGSAVLAQNATAPAPQTPPPTPSDNVTPPSDTALLEHEAEEAEEEAEAGVTLIQAYKVNGVDAPLPVQMRTNSTDFTLDITPVIGQALSLHFQKRVDGWAINENIVGYTFSTLGVAVDFTTGRAYALSDEASSQLRTAITMDHIVTVNGVSSLNGLTNVIITDVTLVDPADIDRNYALTRPDPNPPAPSGSVVAAAARGDIEGIRKLLGAGHNINERDNSGDNALFKAIKINDPALADLLIKGGINVSYTKQGQTALHLATLMGEYSVVRSLLAAGASPGARDAGQNTALMYAVQTDNLDITELLLQYGSAPTQRNAEGFTALMIAASLGKREQIDMLLD